MNKIDTVNLTFNKVLSVIPEDIHSDLMVITESYAEKPWLVDIILYYISDQNPAMSMYENDVIKNLANTLVKFYSGSWSSFFDISSGTLDIRKLIEYNKQDRYMIDAANGFRVATQSEVNEGIYEEIDGTVIQLVNMPTYQIEDSEYKFINLYCWAITGLWRYYIRAGYECEFTKEGIKGPEIKYVYSIRHVIDRMSELLEGQEYLDNIIAKLKNIKKAGVYKYPNYASDEIVPTEKIIFVANQLKRSMPRNKSKLLFECNNILKNHRYELKGLKTEEKLTLRKGLAEVRNPESQKPEISEAEIEELKQLCNKIREGVASGALGQNDFAVKVTSTIMQSNYKRCSPKQKKVIVETVNKIAAAEDRAKQNEVLIKAIEDNKKDTNDIGSMSLADMSNLLGKGLM